MKRLLVGLLLASSFDSTAQNSKTLEAFTPYKLDEYIRSYIQDLQRERDSLSVLLDVVMSTLNKSGETGCYHKVMYVVELTRLIYTERKEESERESKYKKP